MNADYSNEIRTAQAIGSGIEPEPVLLSVLDGQHGPRRRIPWRLLDRPLQDHPHDGVLLGYHPLEVAERAQQRLVPS